MIRGTTPTFTFTIKDDTVDLTEAQNVYVTIRQGSKEITKTGEDIEVAARTVNIFLEQEESIGLAETSAEVQINWTYLDPTDGETVRRAATKVKTIQIAKQLLKRVIE